MTTDKSIEEIAQEYISYMKILEQAGSFPFFYRIDSGITIM